MDRVAILVGGASLDTLAAELPKPKKTLAETLRKAGITHGDGFIEFDTDSHVSWVDDGTTGLRSPYTLCRIDENERLCPWRPGKAGDVPPEARHEEILRWLRTCSIVAVLPDACGALDSAWGRGLLKTLGERAVVYHGADLPVALLTPASKHGTRLIGCPESDGIVEVLSAAAREAVSLARDRRDDAPWHAVVVDDLWDELAAIEHFLRSFHPAPFVHCLRVGKWSELMLSPLSAATPAIVFLDYYLDDDAGREEAVGDIAIQAPHAVVWLFTRGKDDKVDAGFPLLGDTVDGFSTKPIGQSGESLREDVKGALSVAKRRSLAAQRLDIALRTVPEVRKSERGRLSPVALAFLMATTDGDRMEKGVKEVTERTEPDRVAGMDDVAAALGKPREGDDQWELWRIARLVETGPRAWIERCLGRIREKLRNLVAVSDRVLDSARSRGIEPGPPGYQPDPEDRAGAAVRWMVAVASWCMDGGQRRARDDCSEKRWDIVRDAFGTPGGDSEPLFRSRAGRYELLNRLLSALEKDPHLGPDNPFAADRPWRLDTLARHLGPGKVRREFVAKALARLPSRRSR